MKRNSGLYQFNDLQLRRSQNLVATALTQEGMNFIGQPIAFQAETFDFVTLSEELLQIVPESSLSSSEVLLETRNFDLNKKNEVSEADPIFHTAVEQLRTFSDLQRPAQSQNKNTPKIKSITLNVTQICNLHCHYCAAGGDGTFGDPQTKISLEKTLPQIGFLLAKLQPGEHFHISFLGGEPLLYPDGIKLVAEFAQREATLRGLTVTFKVTTNGTLMSDKILQILQDHQIQVVVSCDGPPQIQDSRRPAKGLSSSKMLEKTLQLLSQKPEIYVGVHAVYDSTYTSVLESYEYFKKFDFKFYEFTFSVSKEDSAAQNQFLNQLFQAAQKAYELGGMSELRKIENLNHYFKMFDSRQGIQNHCGIGKSFLMIDAKNEIYPCPWMVNLKNERWGKDLDFLLDEKFQESLIDLHDCTACWAKNLCGGGCHFIHKYGSANGIKSQAFCERTRGIAMMAIYFYGNHYASEDLNSSEASTIDHYTTENVH